MKKQTFKKQLNQFENNLKAPGMHMAMTGRCERITLVEYGEEVLRVFRGKKGALWYDVADIARILKVDNLAQIVREHYKRPGSRVFLEPCGCGENPFQSRVCVDRSGLVSVICEGKYPDTITLMQTLVYDIPQALALKEVTNEA